jgi:uncharacterized membrane protein YeaQ/YmgE (transglycosylase-associated protein family)
MSTIAYILILLLSGLLIGGLARLALPGKDPMSVFQTMLLGIAGTMIAGLIAYYAFDEREGPGFLLALVCSVGLVYLVRKLRQRDEVAPRDPTLPQR